MGKYLNLIVLLIMFERYQYWCTGQNQPCISMTSARRASPLSPFSPRSASPNRCISTKIATKKCTNRDSQTALNAPKLARDRCTGSVVGDDVRVVVIGFRQQATDTTVHGCHWKRPTRRSCSLLKSETRTRMSDVPTQRQGIMSRSSRSPQPIPTPGARGRQLALRLGVARPLELHKPAQILRGSTR